MTTIKEPAPQDGTTHPAESPARETPVGAAPSSEEVRKMVERLRNPTEPYGYQSQLACQAADLIERLAAERAIIRLQHDALMQFEGYDVLPAEWDFAIEAFNKWENGKWLNELAM